VHALLIVGVLAGVVWAISFGGGVRVREQLDVAAGAGDNDADTPMTVGSPINTGMVPAKWAPLYFPGAHLGRHRMYRHPRSCSPHLTAPTWVDNDWRYNPPSEGDL
jgi:hypothetical protein